MLGGVTRNLLPPLPGVPRLHVNRPYVMGILLFSGNSVLKVARTNFLACGVHRARVSHSTFVRARYRKQIWRCAAIFV